MIGSYKTTFPKYMTMINATLASLAPTYKIERRGDSIVLRFRKGPGWMKRIALPVTSPVMMRWDEETMQFYLE